MTRHTPLTPCAQDPDLWFSGAKRKIDRALAGCARCPVRQECAELALNEGEQHGVWGGLTEEQRRTATSRPEALVA